MCWTKHRGGLAQLKDHIRRYERGCEIDRLCLEMKKQNLSEQAEEDMIDHENVNEETTLEVSS